ncbi:hypothetical protein GCM10023192_56280 [Amycolatopsis samaneae]
MVVTAEPGLASCVRSAGEVGKKVPVPWVDGLFARTGSPANVGGREKRRAHGTVVPDGYCSRAGRRGVSGSVGGTGVRRGNRIRLPAHALGRFAGLQAAGALGTGPAFEAHAAPDFGEAGATGQDGATVGAGAIVGGGRTLCQAGTDHRSWHLGQTVPHRPAGTA